MESKIIHGDSREVLKTIESNSIDLVCTDPPYGYSFMSLGWDAVIPSVEIWKECLRVLKPGAFAFVMSAPRQDVLSQMIVRLTEAGFDTSFTSLYWTYASGFPKAMSISKAVDRRAGAERKVTGVKKTPSGQEYPRGYEVRDTPVPFERSDGLETAPATPEAKALDGSYGGFQPKPAVEVILVAMKPLSEKTYVDQALKNGKGMTWLDDGRIPTMTGDNIPAVPQPKSGYASTVFETESGRNGERYDPTRGRFPANILVSDDVLNDGKESIGVRSVRSKPGGARFSGTYNGGKVEKQKVELIGVSADHGSYSRYFSLDAWASKLPESVQRTFPFLLVPKASKREKENGLDGFDEKVTDFGLIGNPETNPLAEPFSQKPRRNTHATVKPLQLMSYLITLGSRPGDKVLDPFVGSGTTVCAAKMLGREGIGIEREEEYVKIAQARLNSVSCPPKEKKTETGCASNALIRPTTSTREP